MWEDALWEIFECGGISNCFAGGDWGELFHLIHLNNESVATFFLKKKLDFHLTVLTLFE